MKRRAFLQATAAAALSPVGTAWAQYNRSPGLPASPSGIVVVELANFYCNRCRQANDHFDRLQRAARLAGHDLRFAPVSWEGQSLWPDRAYYATRDLYPALEPLMRHALFEGLQRDGMIFQSISQVVAYLERRQFAQQVLELEPRFNLADLAEKAGTDDVLLAEAKAGRLVNLSGAQQVPVFVWVQDGELIKTRSTRDANDVIGLVQLVYQDLTQSQSSRP